MRTIALVLIAGSCIAPAVIAQDGEPTSAFPIDPSLEAPAQFTVGRVPNSDSFVYLEFRTVPDADYYRVWRYVDLGETEDVLVSHGTFAPPSVKDADELLTVIVFAPKGAAERMWGVSAQIGDVQTPLAWGRLPMTPTVVRSTSWGAVKADR